MNVRFYYSSRCKGKSDIELRVEKARIDAITEDIQTVILASHLDLCGKMPDEKYRDEAMEIAKIMIGTCDVFLLSDPERTLSEGMERERDWACTLGLPVVWLSPNPREWWREINQIGFEYVNDR